MSSYPKALQYYLTRLNNFSRQKYRVQTIANTTFNPNDLTVIQLPEGLLDLETFTLTGLLSAGGVGGTNTSVYAPPVEMLIDNIMIEIGGISFQSGFSSYGDLFNIFRDFQMFNKKNLRGVLQNDANPSTLTVATTISNRPFAIYNWLGLLGSVKVLDTTILPPVKIYIRWASNYVLSVAGAPTSFAYQITNANASIDILDVDDGIYKNMIASRLANSAIEIPYDNVTTVVGASGAVTNSTRWSTSSDCLQYVIGTLKTNTYLSATHNSNTCLSEFFTRGGANTTVNQSQFFVNGVPYPSIPTDAAIGETFVDTVHAIGESQDMTLQTNPLMNSLAQFNNNFFVHVHSFTEPDDDDGHRLTGISGRGNQCLGNWNLTGSGSNVQPLLFLKHKSVLRVGSSKSVEMVL